MIQRLPAIAVCLVVASTALQARAESDEGHVQVRAGATYRRLYDIPVYGVDFGAALGHWDAKHARYVSLDGFIGRTEYGLHVNGAFLDYRTDWTLGRVHLGYALGPGLLVVETDTNSGSRRSMAVKSSLLLGYELASLGSSVVSIDGSFDFDGVLGDDFTFLWGPTIATSWRF
jgi:hypothetical protein